ncbi:hypothetical protein HMPREF0083_04963 [Aneurinibacillus aneurinilyticus ATCC 12856]|uniref:Uncharacterized protein n=1 Tax=Aneurinibacillus aneurinilyticus ATCC 12856 TaxID=649747 RepID=U1WEG1_ANEAE|nr:hypothetical protein HMPREF0083_04963 [Aneurinibacillus aneurinilyticus ATCC 12856]
MRVFWKYGAFLPFILSKFPFLSTLFPVRNAIKHLIRFIQLKIFIYAIKNIDNLFFV